MSVPLSVVNKSLLLGSLPLPRFISPDKMAAVEEPGLRRYIRDIVIGMHQKFIRLMKTDVGDVLLARAPVVVPKQPCEMRIT